MSSDISRQRFDPANNFSGVLMQQGRVQLDADWNEWNEILDRRWRSETIDIIGRCIVPLQTPNGFQIQLSGGSLTIGPGRIYVDGLQAENHGAGELDFDAVLAESAGTEPLPYDRQPYFPNAPALPDEAGPHLVYIDVWEREVTSIENPALVENAVGVDTTARAQTAWQVRVLPNVGADATCGGPDENLPGWLDIIAPSAGRLTTAAVGVATADDPCLIPPSGGYRGLENRTYRVEIHDGGAVGATTFKWSRDNASVATGVSAIEGDTTLTVDRAVWDSARRFSPGDWVEITDDWREFSGAPGDIRRIASVVDASRTITLDLVLATGAFPVDGQNLTDPSRHTRIKRWDQSGIVRDSNGNTYVDLDASGGVGLIAVPDAGTSLILEDGVEVTFTIAPSGSGEFRAGDYWIFVARTADASVEALEATPPRGVHHHYGRLGLITFPDQVVDCRIFWPPSLGEGESCDCTICVTAEQHNQGQATIQNAVNQLLQSGGTICLGPGVFILREPVQLAGAKGVRIRGQGAATIVMQPREGSAFAISNALWCTLDYLTIQALAPFFEATIQLANSVGTTIERIIVGVSASGVTPTAGIGLGDGFLGETRIRDNLIWAETGVIYTPNEKTTTGLLLGSFSCEHNFFQCAQAGVRLDGKIFYGSDTVLARNLIAGTTLVGISATGSATPTIEISGNTINPQSGDGIVIAASGGAQVDENRLVNLDAQGVNGLRITTGDSALAALPIAVKGNYFQGWTGPGLTIEAGLVSLLVAENIFKAIGGAAIIMQPNTSVGVMQISGNEFIDVANAASTANLKGVDVAAIYLRGLWSGAISDNTLAGVAANAQVAATLAGLRIEGSIDVRINDNSIVDLGPRSQFGGAAAGILALSPSVNLEIAGNLIKRQVFPDTTDESFWQAICIKETGDTLVGRFAAFEKLPVVRQIQNMQGFMAASAPVSQHVGILGNSLHGYGRAPLVTVAVAGSCRFSDNYCTDLAEELGTEVAINAGSVIAASNRVEGPTKARSLDVSATNQNAASVLGNIVAGEILLNGAPLLLPWQPLNVIGA
jgi:hypothetical protein